MPVRKNLLYMPASERDAFFEALLKMKAHIVNPLDPPDDQYSVYDQFVFLHLGCFSVVNPVSGVLYNAGHGGPAFLSWHRELLMRFEKALQDEVPGVMLPYWDWSPSVFVDSLMGPNGGALGVGGGVVETGYFAYHKPGTGTNTSPLPAFWPASLPGWRIRPDLDDTSDGAALRRFIGTSGGDILPGTSDVDVLLATTSPSTFRSYLEAGRNLPTHVSSHNEVHRYIGGHMGAAASPNDPIFWLHHCNIDRIWAMWQLDGRMGTSFFPASVAFGHTLASAMWPWTGATVYGVEASLPAYYVPNFSTQPAVLCSAQIDHHALGYAYDTEPVLGVSVDRSGSMTGMTSDPFSGMAPISKWELAKKGVKNLLADCEAAYSTREAYVTAGVTTFTTSGASAVVDPVISATPYGLVRTGNPADEAAVSAALNALSPGGGTPIAQGVLQTYSNAVRPSSNALPADDVRYLAILTDGKETSGPMLSSIGPGQLGDTWVYGMGLGSGTGWDGVDYATIETIASKGREPATAASRVYHGENVGEIDKFFTNTVAAAIGYVPSLDPRFDLFPGEHVHLPFYVTSADGSVMITVLRGNAEEGAWHIALIDPTGAHYHESTTSPVSVTLQRRGDRDTIFVRRDHAKATEWVGRWHLHIAYGRPAEEEDSGHEGTHGEAPHVHDAHDAMSSAPHELQLQGMVMPTPWDLMIPTGAPPLKGAVFTRFATPASKRASTRLLPGKGKAAAVGLGGPTLGRESDKELSAAVLVNIYVKSTLSVDLALSDKAKFAGEKLDLSLSIRDNLGASVTQTRALARLVAPGRSPGQAFLDARTIPVADRARFLVKGAETTHFDELAFLAAYESKKPGFFQPRDERLTVRHERGNTLRATIDDTRTPGVYRVGVYVEGALRRGDGPPEWFTRVLNVERSLGTAIDPGRSMIHLQWLTPNRLVVTMMPQDRFGNILSPNSVDAPVLRLGGVSVAHTRAPSLDGTQKLEVEIAGDGLSVDLDGRGLDRAASVKATSGENIPIAAGKPIQMTVELAGRLVPVALPKLVVHLPTGKTFRAGSPGAMALPIEERCCCMDEGEVAGVIHSHGGHSHDEGAGD